MRKSFIHLSFHFIQRHTLHIENSQEKEAVPYAEIMEKSTQGGRENVNKVKYLKVEMKKIYYLGHLRTSLTTLLLNLKMGPL